MVVKELRIQKRMGIEKRMALALKVFAKWSK